MTALMKPADAPTFLESGQGQEIIAGGNVITVKVGPALGSVGISVFESLVGPGGVFLHLHREYEEAFYVLAGEIEFHLGNQTHIGRVGASAYVPVGVVHGFARRGSEAARLLVVHSPARALTMVEELSQVMNLGDPAKVISVLAKHKTEAVR